MSEQAQRIAFVVEGDPDKAVVEALAQRIWRVPSERIRTVRLGGRAAIPWLWDTVLTLLEDKGYDHVVVLLDAHDDEEDPEEAASALVAEIKAELATHRIDEKRVSILLAVPVLEAWLLADREEQPEVPDAKQRLHGILGRWSPDKLAEMVRDLDLDKARRRSPSLDAFLAALEDLRPSAA
jgi:hypothetical protein